MYYLRMILLTVLVVPLYAHAQTLAPDLSIEAVPAQPAPGERVTLTARSYGIDLSQSVLVWTYNGATVARETGKTSIEVTAPLAGAVGTATVSTGFGLETASASIALRPGALDLLWEAADAYTPPFYKGKALVPVGGIVRVTAIPAASAPRGISYRWERNGSALENLSGYNRTSITFRHSPFTPSEAISVNAGSGTFSSVGAIRITAYEPLLIAYEDLEGFIGYNRGFDSEVVSSNPNGTVLRFEPYYFSVPNSVQKDLSFEIKAGDQLITTSPQNELAVSAPEDGLVRQIRIAITTVAYTLQNLQTDLRIRFQ